MAEDVVQYKAISIDTNIFIRYQWQFNRGMLSTLTQFLRSDAEMIIPRIIRTEMAKHFGIYFNDRKREVAKGLKSSRNFFNIENKYLDKINSVIESESIQEDMLNGYLESTGCEIIPCDKVNGCELCEMYGDILPPFEKSGKKKEEFPDAIALLALEKWANENGKKILVVSDDSGWSAFAEKSSHLDVVEDISIALEFFQPTLLIGRIKSLLENDESVVENIENEVETQLEDFFENISVSPEAYSTFGYEIDQAYVTLDEYEIVDDEDGNIIFRIIEANEGSFTIEITVRVKFSYNISFSYYVRDSIDKDYIDMGTSSHAIVEKDTISILIDFEGDVAKGREDIILTDISIDGNWGDIDLGEIGPDWYYEEANFE